MTKKIRWAALTALLLVFAGTTFAQGNGNGKNKLPNGKPFQILANAIKNLDAKLQQQIAGLQAQLDANGAADAVRQQMIDALLVAVQMHEARLGALQVRIEDVQAYQEVQDARIAFLAAQTTSLQAQVNAHAGAIDFLVQLHNSQQSAILDLAREITVLQTVAFQLSAYTSTILGTIANLNGQLAALTNDYQVTKLKLAAGCPAGTAIRAVGFTGDLSCQPSSGPAAIAQIVQVVTVPAVGVGARMLACPAGTYAVGGGVVFPGAIGQLQASTPATPSAWFVQVLNTSPAPLDFVATVNCMVVP